MEDKRLSETYRQLSTGLPASRKGGWENWKTNVSKTFEEEVKGYIEKYISVTVPNLSNLRFDLWLGSERFLGFGILEVEAKVVAIQ